MQTQGDNDQAKNVSGDDVREDLELTGEQAEQVAGGDGKAEIPAATPKFSSGSQLKQAVRGT